MARFFFGSDVDLMRSSLLYARLHNASGTGGGAGELSGPFVDGQLYYHAVTGERRVRFYDSALASWVGVPRLDYDETVTGNMTFSRSSLAPFTVGGPSAGKYVAGLNAQGIPDTADNSKAMCSGAVAASVSTVAIRTSGGQVKVADPTDADDAINKGWAENYMAQRLVHGSARVAAVSNITRSGPQTIDGVSIVENDIVLVCGQTASEENGIYTVASGEWTRTPSADTWAELVASNGSRAYVWITEGSSYSDTGWLCMGATTGTIGVTDQPWTQVDGKPAVSAGNGIVKVGNTIHAVTSSNYTQGSLIYASGANTLGQLGLNSSSTRKFLVDYSSGVPAWDTLIAADLPTHNQAWSTITGTPTTRAGYGITDAQAIYWDRGDGVMYPHTISDKLGLGTTSPAHPLEIVSSDETSLTYYRSGVAAKKWGFMTTNLGTYWSNITDGVNGLELTNSGSLNVLLNINAAGTGENTLTGDLVVKGDSILRADSGTNWMYSETADGPYGSILNIGAGQYLGLNTYTQGGGWVEMIRMANDGKLGIGVTSGQISTTLQVDGPTMLTRGARVSNVLVAHKIYTMGDSLTARGYVQKYLNSILGATWACDNKGIPGDSTTGMRNRIYNEVVISGDAEYVVIWGGVNDVFQNASAATIEGNLQAMYTACHAAGIKVIALNIAPCKNHAGWTAGKQAVIDAVNTWIASSAANVDYKIDIYSLLEDPGSPDALQAAYDLGDGLHINDDGCHAISGAIILGSTFTPRDASPVALTVDGLSVADSGSAPTGAFLISDPDTTSLGLSMGLDVTAVSSWIQSRGIASTSKFPLSLNPSGGNVGVGLAASSYPFEVAGTNGTSFAYQRTGVSAKKFGFTSENTRTYWGNLTDNVIGLCLTNAGNVTPGADGTRDLGATDLRWGTGYFTGLTMGSSTGVVKAVTGAFGVSAVVNADIDASAAIAWTKMSTTIATSSSALGPYLISESGVVKSRTLAQVLSDIGAANSDHTHSIYQPLDATLSTIAAVVGLPNQVLVCSASSPETYAADYIRNSYVASDAAIVWSKLAKVSAAARILGLASGASAPGNISELTGANVRTICGLATGDSPTFTGLTLSGFTVDGLVKSTSGALSTTTDMPSGTTIGSKTVARKYTVSLTGTYPKRVNHGLGSTAIICMIRDTSTGELGSTNFDVYDTNNIDVDFVTAPADNTYELIVIG